MHCLRREARCKKQEIAIYSFAQTFYFCIICAYAHPAELCNDPQHAQLLSLVKKGKVFGQAFFKRLAGRGAEPHKHSVRSARGELENSSVNCFLRGEALQERASPLKRPYLFFLRALACAIAICIFATFAAPCGAHTLTACEQSVKCRKNPSPP